ncbi:hypothetical protein [Pseudomonas abietaniphila]|uniref:hypothetical protein n=1 Tax=Pseudomonas abietaniphila TaxID=89065 RepID=UPI000783B105|nr:hypothetical protein [Pseudomonas abietaniphila]
MAATTPIPLLPDAPSRSDGQAAFNAKADPFIAALPPMVVNINSRLTWIWQQVGVIDGYRQAAAQSASDASGYANAADSSKGAAAQSAIDATNNGQAKVDQAAQQVQLAANQVALAQSAADSALASAAAAGAAAGQPALNGAGNLLTINPANNGVIFTSPLPLLHATALLF